MHIGTTKTGTTSIQFFLDRHREQLRARGYFYLAPFSHMCWDRARLPTLAGVLHSALHQASCAHVIISSEILQLTYVGEEQVREFRALLEGLGLSDIRIIIYLRDPVAHFVSTVSQDIRMRRLDDRTQLPLPQHNRVFCIICDYRTTLESWGAVFGRDQLRVRLFSPEALYHGDVVEDFTRLVGLNWDAAWQHPPRLNESYNLLEMAVLKPVNRIVRSEAVRVHLRGYLQKYLGGRTDPQLRFAPPPSTL